jgi:hypothetical protein
VGYADEYNIHKLTTPCKYNISTVPYSTVHIIVCLVFFSSKYGNVSMRGKKHWTGRQLLNQECCLAETGVSRQAEQTQTAY